MQNTSNTGFAIKTMNTPVATPNPVNTPASPMVSVPANESSLEKSSLVSRNVTVGGHRTSVRLEPDMWNGLRDICRREHLSIHDVATAIAARKPSNSSLTAAIRVFVMAYFRAAATEDGHTKAGHGPGGYFMVNWGLQKQAATAMMGHVASGMSSMGGLSPQNRMNTVMRRF